MKFIILALMLVSQSIFASQIDCNLTIKHKPSRKSFTRKYRLEGNCRLEAASELAIQLKNRRRHKSDVYVTYEMRFCQDKPAMVYFEISEKNLTRISGEENFYHRISSEIYSKSSNDSFTEHFQDYPYIVDLNCQIIP